MKNYAIVTDGTSGIGIGYIIVFRTYKRLRSELK